MEESGELHAPAILPWEEPTVPIL